MALGVWLQNVEIAKCGGGGGPVEGDDEGGGGGNPGGSKSLMQVSITRGPSQKMMWGRVSCEQPVKDVWKKRWNI